MVLHVLRCRLLLSLIRVVVLDMSTPAILYKPETGTMTYILPTCMYEHVSKCIQCSRKACDKCTFGCTSPPFETQLRQQIEQCKFLVFGRDVELPQRYWDCPGQIKMVGMHQRFPILQLLNKALIPRTTFVLVLPSRHLHHWQMSPP